MTAKGRRWLKVCARSFRVSLRRSREPEFTALWKFALASVAFLVFALITASGAVFGDEPWLAGLLASAACLALSIANAIYVVWRVRRAEAAAPLEASTPPG